MADDWVNDDQCVEFAIFDDDLSETSDSGVETKFSYDVQPTGLGGQSNPLEIIDVKIGGGELALQCTLPQIIHGSMFEGITPATLLVLQFAFVSQEIDRRFKSARIEIKFSAGHIHSISPELEWTTLHSETRRESQRKFTTSLEAGLDPFKASTGYEWGRTETTDIKGHCRLNGLKHAKSIDWGLFENGSRKPPSGLPVFLQTAVLLETDTASQLSAEIVIKGEIDGDLKNVRDTADGAGKAIKSFITGKHRKGEPIIFDLKKSRVAEFMSDNVIKNLGLVKLSDYQRLVAAQRWVEADGKAKGQETEPSLTVAEKSLHASPLKTVDKSAEIPVTTTTATSNTVVERAVKITNAKLLAAVGLDVPGNQRHTPSAETLTGYRRSTTLSATVRDELPAGSDRSTKRWKIQRLQEQLALVRAEAELVNKLVDLKREEKRLHQAIMELEDCEIS